jgi:diketogulonate reductase-like aldo/keto reductase
VSQERFSPYFMYGTAWKEDESRRLTRLAIESGFRAIDTANQRKHYHEVAVGEGIADAVDAGLVTREDLFLQTKFTYLAGQDARLPYDPQADFPTQVRQSFQSSLEHLRTERLDSYVLHGPSRSEGLGEADYEVWKTMEAIQREGGIGVLGVSNVSLGQLEALCAAAEVQPSFVQNRCYARRGWDREVRAFCRERGIVYQGFSLLTANRRELKLPAITGPAERSGKTPAQVVFRFALEVGMLPLTGTTDAGHMREDLAAAALELTPEEVAAIEACSG